VRVYVYIVLLCADTLLEEAENERMHLLTFLELRKPGPFMRFMVLVAQGEIISCHSGRHQFLFIIYIVETLCLMP
jgi:hypothetical protein